MEWYYQQVSIQNPKNRYIKASLNRNQHSKSSWHNTLSIWHTYVKHQYTDIVIKTYIFRHTTHNTYQITITSIKKHWLIVIQFSVNKQHNAHRNKYHSVNTKKVTEEEQNKSIQLIDYCTTSLEVSIKYNNKYSVTNNVVTRGGIQWV